MKKATVATSCILSAICLANAGFAASGTMPYNRHHGASHSCKAPQNARRLVPGMRVINQIMGFHLAPAVGLMPGMRIIHAETVSDPDDNCQQIFYALVSNQPAAKLYKEYQQFYGKRGKWRGNIGSPGYGRYLFYLRVPPSRRAQAVFVIREKMEPEEARYIGSQQAYAKSSIDMSIFVPSAYSQKYQQQHHGSVQYPLPVDPVK